MSSLKFRLKSVCMLLQHDDKAANPFNEYAKQLKIISSKRKKTEEDLRKMAAIEWMAGLYYTPKEGYYMKMECIEGALYEAAKTKKLGKVFKEAVRLDENPAFHFEHEGLPPTELFEKDGYQDLRTVKIQRSRILRCRPKFREWYCDIEIFYDPSRVNEYEIKEVLEYAGRYTGLCDYRPKYGRFTATEI